MFLEKIKSASSGAILYGLTPPKASTQPERVAEIAQKNIEQLTDLDIDALVVYDVQNESARTTDEDVRILDKVRASWCMVIQSQSA